MGLAALALALLSAAGAAGAAGAVGAACPLQGTREFRSKAELPAGVAEALGFRMAERGAPFQATDDIAPGPRLPATRFVAARRTNCRLALRYEQGGIAHTWETALLEYRGNRWVLLARRLQR